MKFVRACVIRCNREFSFFEFILSDSLTHQHANRTAGLKRMTGLRSAGLLVLLLGVTISVARAQYGDYQGAGASRGYDGEYDYAEGEDDYDEEDYNTDLAAQSYDYEEQIQVWHHA